MRLTYPLAFYWAQIALQVLLLVAMHRRGQWQRFPVFVGYMLYTALFSAVLLVVTKPYWLYFWTYWIGMIPEVVLAIALIWELYSRCLSPYRALQQMTSGLFLLAVLVLLSLAIVLAVLAPGSSTSRLMTAVMSLDRSAMMLTSGLIAVLFAAMYWLRLPWNGLALGIANGLALYSLVSLTTVVITAELGQPAWAMWKAVHPMAWTCANLVWAVAVLRPEKEMARELVPAEPLLRWNRSLSEFLGAR